MQNIEHCVLPGRGLDNVKRWKEYGGYLGHSIIANMF